LRATNFVEKCVVGEGHAFVFLSAWLWLLAKKCNPKSENMHIEKRKMLAVQRATADPKTRHRRPKNALLPTKKCKKNVQKND